MLLYKENPLDYVRDSILWIYLTDLYEFSQPMKSTTLLINTVNVQHIQNCQGLAIYLVI